MVTVPVRIPEPDSGEGASSEGESPRRPSGVAPSNGVSVMPPPGGTGFVGERPSAGPAAPTAACPRPSSAQAESSVAKHRAAVGRRVRAM
ncbi:hypothetical protein ADK76_04055 [Streptomyces griseoflavus]|nr:hypothetical protein ADK76_04055 [Streptomyces griseoflavus]